MGSYVPQAGKGSEGLPGFGGVYNALNKHVYAYAHNNPIKYTDPDGRTPAPTNLPTKFGPDGFYLLQKWMDSLEGVRDRIADLASSKEGSRDWLNREPRTASGFTLGRDTFKCSMFVYEILKEAGADPGSIVPGNLINAGEWADPKQKISGWRVLGPGEAPMPGDVAAIKNPGKGYTGHVGIVTGENKITGTYDEGGVVKEFSFKDMENIPPGGGVITFRRWEGNDY